MARRKHELLTETEREQLIGTDSHFRWRELQHALRPRFGPAVAHLGALAREIESTCFFFPNDALTAAKLSFDSKVSGYPRLMAEAFTYLSRIASRGPKPNWEAAVAARFVCHHAKAQAELTKQGIEGTAGRVRCAFPAGGIQDNTINRLLLMSSSEHHLPSLPIAFFIEPAKASVGVANAILANRAQS